MECNRDEALKAKEIAEHNLLEGDIMGAKKFALKAQNLFPMLEGLSQFLEIIDVYVANEKKINGEADYYGILGVDPFADEEVLKKHYRRMALSLHPDKNKSVGADGAFKILSQAWSVLRDRDMRSTYNLKLNMISSTQMASFSWLSARSTTTATNSQNVPYRQQSPPTATGQQYTRSNTYSQQIPRSPFQHKYTPATFQPTWSPRPSRPETFWTSCNRCKTQFEYHKIFLYQYLLCLFCKIPFLAIEEFVPIVKSKQQDMPTVSSVPNLTKMTSEAASSSKGRERWHEELSRNREVEAAVQQSSCRKQLSKIEIRHMLQEKAKIEIMAKIEIGSATAVIESY